MLLVRTLLPLLLAFTFTSAIPVSGITRSASTILSDIDSIDSDFDSISSDVSTFTQTVVAWNGNILGLAALVLILQKLESDLTTTAYDIASSGTFDSADSKSIFLSVTTLTPTFGTLLNDLDAKVSLCDEVLHAQMTDKFDYLGFHHRLNRAYFRFCQPSLNIDYAHRHSVHRLQGKSKS